jgi:hypothetical protein
MPRSAGYVSNCRPRAHAHARVIESVRRPAGKRQFGQPTLLSPIGLAHRDRRRRALSNALDRCESSGADRLGRGLVVAVVLVGVALGEVGDRLVEAVTLAEIRGDRDRVSRRPGVRPSKRPSAEARVRGERGSRRMSTFFSEYRTAPSARGLLGSRAGGIRRQARSSSPADRTCKPTRPRRACGPSSPSPQ